MVSWGFRSATILACEMIAVALIIRWPFNLIRQVLERRTNLNRMSKAGCSKGIVSKPLGSLYRSGRSRHWVKSKNPQHPAVKREAQEDWGRERWR